MQENKQAYIYFILDELNKGNVQYKDVCLEMALTEFFS
jgi:hypothetical protein